MNKNKITEYLQNSRLMKVPQLLKKRLNEDISTEEFFEAITALKPGKAPGMDGLTVGFYKFFKKQLTPYLGQIMNRGLN